ncbi:unnamed protein product [Spirodela intermedia]|uniref:Uncharacterized protein n=1 Tax=Spirodela intermedia TaxID=51605 RepID=A0A7I8JLA2_SPIIN|nr:unnamed protein product [Spirodela intermedia]CAA6670541.1 unnamed protein product [Spirodela intermedia]
MYGGGIGVAEEAPLLAAHGRSAGDRNAKSYLRCASHASDELRSFRSWLRWMCVDQSGPWRAALSWGMFLVLAAAVPLTSHFVVVVDADREGRRRHASYDAVVQLSLTSVAALSFVCLSAFFRHYGLRRFLFLDKLCGESETVRQGYTFQLNRSFKLLSMFVLPCFAAECGYKIWWYCKGEGRIPFLGTPTTSIFFLVCVLFRLICHLQILRLQDFGLVFQDESDVASILAEHLRIRRQLRVISHRFRSFIVTCLIVITLSQLASLLLTTRSKAEVNLYNAGELALCSVGLVTGILICLRSATKITHKAQAITSHAAKWHAFATVESFDPESEAPLRIPSGRVHPLYGAAESDYDELGDEDDLADTNLVKANTTTISFQKRQALVTYLENNRAGITVFGFMLDRSWLHMIFGVELSLVLWLLGKTVGFS